MSRSKKPLPTHWTAHSCLVAGLSEDEPPLTLTPDRAREDAMLQYGGTWIGCRTRRQRKRPPGNYSTRIADVTCTRCRERYEDLVRYWVEPRDTVYWGSPNPNGLPLGCPAAAVIQAHKRCCQERGAPLLVDKRELAAWNRELRSRTVRILPTHLAALAVFDADRVSVLEQRAELIREVDPDLLEALHPAVADLALVVDLLAEADKLMANASAHIATVKAAVLTGAIDDRRMIGAIDDCRVAGSQEAKRRVAANHERMTPAEREQWERGAS